MRYYADIRYEHPITGESRRERKATPHESKRKARRWAEQRLRDWTNRNWWLERQEREKIAQAPSVEAFADTFIDTMETRLSPSTVETYGYRLDWIIEVLGDKPIHKVSGTDFDDLMAVLVQQGRAQKTISNTFGVLSKMLSEAVKEGWREDVPDIEWPDVPEPDWQRLKRSQAQELLKSADDDEGRYPIGTMVYAALHTGCRLGELLALQWQKVDLSTSRIYVHRAKDPETGEMKSTKGKRNRTIPISDDLVARLEAHRESQSDSTVTRFVFADEEGESLTKQRIYEPLRRAYNRTDIPDEIGGWHVLRHTYASHLASSGTPLRVVQRLLGHQSLEQTERYAHLLPGTEEMAVPHLDGYLD